MDTEIYNNIYWNEYIKCCNSLIEYLIKDEMDSEDIGHLSISRGGLIPSTIISNFFNRKFQVIGIDSYNENNQQDKFSTYQNCELSYLKEYNKIFVIDDLIDSGNTLEYINQYLLSINNNLDINYYTLFTKNKFENKNNFKIKSLHNIEDKWIIFPYERIV